MEKSLLTKICVIAVIIAGITIMLGSISGIISERADHRQTASYSIQTAWAGGQHVIGPVLLLPFKSTTKHSINNPHLNSSETYDTVRDETRRITPNTLKVIATTKVEERYRGIYSFPVYTTSITLSGDFAIPEELQSSELSIVTLEPEATLEIATSDARGFTGETNITWDSNILTSLPGVSLPGSKHGIHAKLSPASLESGKLVPFEISFNLKGLDFLSVAAIGKDTNIAVNGNWPHPKFVGNFLPTTREIDDSGFSASWSLNYFATGLAQSSTQCNEQANCTFNDQMVGFELFDPIDLYHLTERSVKYGILFITLTCALFFVFEILKSLQIHPIQYGFVACMQAVFYLVLLSLSEHISFPLAYTLACAACVAVISFYLQHVLKSKKRGLGFGLGFAALYAVLYFVLRSADFALLLGTGVVFAVLSAGMILTREIDWYSLNLKKKTSDIALDTPN